MPRRSERNFDINERDRRTELSKQKYCSAERELRDALLALWAKEELDGEDGVIELIVKYLGERHIVRFEDEERPNDYWLTRKRGFSLAYAE